MLKDKFCIWLISAKISLGIKDSFKNEEIMFARSKFWKRGKSLIVLRSISSKAALESSVLSTSTP